MVTDIYYDDRALMELIEALSPKERIKGMRNAFSRIGTQMRKRAVQNMRQAVGEKVSGSSTFRSNKNTERGIRKVMSRRNLGFRITVGTRRGKVRNLDTKAAREQTIVALLAEGGTGKRKTRNTRTKRGIIGRGRYTGSMPAFRFMERTKANAYEEATAMLEKEIIKSIEKIAHKKGCGIR